MTANWILSVHHDETELDQFIVVSFAVEAHKGCLTWQAEHVLLDAFEG